VMVPRSDTRLRVPPGVGWRVENGNTYLDAVRLARYGTHLQVRMPTGVRVDRATGRRYRLSLEPDGRLVATEVS
jgi:hypothetical protein